MPSRAVIKAAARAANAPAPSGTGVSPLIASYGGWVGGRPNSAALPRDPAEFLNGTFGPLTPITPVPVDSPDDGQERPDPRRWQYQVGWNMPIGQPGTEGLKLADFATLRTLADMYSVARACIQLRKAETVGIGWDVGPTKDAAKAQRSVSEAKDFGERRAEVLKFFRRPDPNYNDFTSWFEAVLEDIFVTDALSIYLHPSRVKGKGLLGSDLAALDIIAGETIRPLIDVRGGRPAPPNPAFQQYLYGVPRVDMMTVLSGEDVAGERMVAEYRGDQLLYLPFNPRSWTPYGQPPLEQCIVPVITGLRKQQYALQFFDEGTLPGAYVSPGDTNLTPNQIAEMQTTLNAIAGDPAWKHKIIVLPPGSHVDPQRPPELADQTDEIIMTQVCMAYGVMPMELGIAPKVSATQSSGAAHQMAKASESINERKALKPLLLWMKSNIFDRVIRDICGQQDMEWRWEGLEEDEDELTLAQLLTAQVSAGLSSIDEARIEIGREPWGLPQTSEPGWATQTGFVPLTAVPMAPPAAPAQPSTAPAGNADEEPPRPPSTDGHGTPAHAAADAAQDAHEAPKPQGAAPKTAGASKALLAELDSLGRHLRKGRDVSTWKRRHLPAHTLAILTEDLGKGLTVEQAVTVARSTLPKSDDDREGEQRRHVDWPGWNVDQDLAAGFASDLRAALGRALDMSQARRIAADWLTVAAPGKNPDFWLQVTHPDLADAARAALAEPLARIWRRGWALGEHCARALLPDSQVGKADRSSQGEAGSQRVVDEVALRDWLAQQGIDSIASIADTRMGDLADALNSAVEEGWSVDQLAGEIEAFAADEASADLVATTELARAVSQGALASYDDAGVGEVAWLAAPGACRICQDNESAGSIPINQAFPSGATAPPAHPRCRCALAPATLDGIDLLGAAQQALGM